MIYWIAHCNMEIFHNFLRPAASHWERRASAAINYKFNRNNPIFMANGQNRKHISKYKQNINHVKLCGHLPRRHSLFDCLPFAVCHLSSLMSQVYINIFLWTSKAQHTNPHINLVKLIMMKRVNFGFKQPKYTKCKWCLCLFWDLPWCTNERNERKGFGLRILQSK